jgi:glucuronokinase
MGVAMLLIRQHAYARAGFMGNPSDGYGGKTISVSLGNFWADVVLYEWEDVELVWSQEDQSRFRSVHDLVRDVQQHGYYGGIRLVKATVKKFVEFCVEQGLPLHDRNFSLRYQTNIPRQVGLAGSSAIVVATLRCLIDFYEMEDLIPLEVRPSLALAVETQELGLPAGLQDRVIQVYEGLVFMDFAPEKMTERYGCKVGVYERLDPAQLPPLYIAYNPEGGKAVQGVHSTLRVRFDQGDPEVLAAMKHFAGLTVEARAALEARDWQRLHELMNENFDTRRRITQVRDDYLRLVETARGTGASAKFAGSGGAILGMYRDEDTLRALEKACGAIGCRVEKVIVPARGGPP